MSYKIKGNIYPGQVTLFRGTYYKARAMKKRYSCRAQCDCMIGFKGNGNCSALCFKYNNGQEIVFEKLDGMPKDAEIVITDFQAGCEEVTEQIAIDCEAIEQEERKRFDSDIAEKRLEP